VSDLEDFEFAVADRFRHIPSLSQMASQTPRELIEQLAQVTSESPVDPRSVTHYAFHQVRDIIAQETRSDSSGIRPTTLVATLLTDPQDRRRIWRAIRARFAIAEFPSLARSTSVERLIAIVAAGAFLGLLSFVLVEGALPGIAVLVAGSGSLAVLWALLRVTEQSAVHVQPPNLTVGDLAIYATAYGSPILGPLAVPLSRSQITEVIRALVQLEIGVRKSDLEAKWDDLAVAARAR
jgi:hypothetical protein